MFLAKVLIFFAYKRIYLSHVLFVMCLLLLPVLAYAQNHARLQTREVSRKGKYYSRQTATVRAQKSYLIDPGFTFTSMSLRISPSEDFTGSYIVSEKDTFFLQQDEHQPEKDSLKQANLIILEKPSQHVLFYPGSIRGNVTFSFMNAATGQKEEIRPGKHLRKQQQAPQKGSCKEPDLIEQSVWRAGLPAPDYQRATSSVRHVIVHHSAGSNTNTNYVSVVRNIYLFHTQDRAWSDIGYNYLIAPDGTIFEGRSPGGQYVARDDIRGAHFCGKNSGTIGVCVLGNYNTAIPTTAALSSLISLTAWKLYKEGLDPFVMLPHPANPALEVIAGHRDGCATECPGNYLYSRLDEIRLLVQERIEENCEHLLTLNVYPVPSNRLLYVTVPDDIPDPYHIFLYDMEGKAIDVPVYQKEEQWALDVSLLTKGAYIVKVSSKGFHAERKVILLPDS